MATAVCRVFASCSVMVPFSPARIRELPPTATKAVFAIHRSSPRGAEASWHSWGRALPAAFHPPDPELWLPLQLQHRVTDNCIRRRLGRFAGHQFQHDRLLG